MHLMPIAPRPLSGSSLQLALLLPVFMLLFLCPVPGPEFRLQGRPVLLPNIEAVPLPVAGDHDIVISVQADGCTFIGARWYPSSELLAGIQERLSHNRLARVIIRVDRSLPFRSVRSLFHVLRSAGVPSASLVTYEGVPPSLDVPLPVFRKPAT